MSPSRYRRSARQAAALAVTVAAAYAAPAVAALGPVRNRYLPELAGVGRPGHLALTFDDGPDPESTPRFLDALAGHGLTATFFVLGSQLARYRSLGHRIVAAGHELALHGWQHRCHLWRGPWEIGHDLARARDLATDIAGYPPRWFRPPFGVLTGATLLACRRLELTPVLWTCWGRDWTAHATSDSVRAAVTRHLSDGATILLHDTASPTAAPGSWQATLGALPGIIRHARRRGWQLGPLREHGLGHRPPATGRSRPGGGRLAPADGGRHATAATASTSTSWPG